MQVNGRVSHPHQVGSLTHLQPVGLFLELLFPTGVEAPKSPFGPATGILLQTHPTTHTLLSPTYCSNSFAQAPVSVIHRLQGGPWSLLDKQLLASSMSPVPCSEVSSEWMMGGLSISKPSCSWGVYKVPHRPRVCLYGQVQGSHK